MSPNLKILKLEFREFCVEHLVLRQIDDVFTSADFQRTISSTMYSGERRTRVEEYYASADWSNMKTIRCFMTVLENVLLLSFIPAEAKEQLRSHCREAGFEVDNDGYEIHLTTKGVGRQLKNLIFAADGPKPEIVLSDSVSNDIEVVNNADSPRLYAEMVAEDRNLQLAGYEVYRFGGYELMGDEAQVKIESFFTRLFERHEVTMSST